MTQWGLDNLFNPGKRHMDDEKRRLQSTREEIGDNSGGRRIDLEGGKVSIAVRRATDVVLDEPAEDDDVVATPALEAEELPAVALATDDAEIAPEVVDDTEVEPVEIAEVVEVVAVVESAPATEVAVEEVAEVEPAEVVVVVEDELEAVEDDVPIEAPAPPPVVTAPRRKQLSASAWSRRG